MTRTVSPRVALIVIASCGVLAVVGVLGGWGVAVMVGDRPGPSPSPVAVVSPSADDGLRLDRATREACDMLGDTTDDQRRTDAELMRRIGVTGSDSQVRAVAYEARLLAIDADLVRHSEGSADHDRLADEMRIKANQLGFACDEAGWVRG